MKKLSFLIIFISLFFVFQTKAHASQGIIELQNQEGTDAECYGASGLMEDNNYKVLVLCQDILYPGGTSVSHYVVWANPVDGGSPNRLGTLSLGKVLLTTKEAFSSLFVTRETSSTPRSPNGPVVMQGGVQRISMFEDNSNNANEPELGTPEPSPTPQPQKSSFNILRLGGIFGFIALFLIVLFVLVITRR